MAIPVKKNNLFERQLFSMTTIIEGTIIKDGNVHKWQASGFYYNEVSPSDPSKTGGQWVQVDKTWLVTNRHVVLPTINNEECVPDTFSFNIRETNNGQICWRAINIDRTQLLAALRLHKDKEVDVAIIDATLFIREFVQNMIATGNNNLHLPAWLSNTNLPENQPLNIEVTSDIIVASYPKGFYDRVNKFPIVKSGIIASAWGLPFNGKALFEIDAQLFPGSSGGLVISKPTNIALIDGHIKFNESKQFVFLGVYSGEYRWEESRDIGGNKVKTLNSYGLGNVWYSYLIPQIIESGEGYTSSRT